MKDSYEHKGLTKGDENPTYNPLLYSLIYQ